MGNLKRRMKRQLERDTVARAMWAGKQEKKKAKEEAKNETA